MGDVNEVKPGWRFEHVNEATGVVTAKARRHDGYWTVDSPVYSACDLENPRWFRRLPPEAPAVEAKQRTASQDDQVPVGSEWEFTGDGSLRGRSFRVMSAGSDGVLAVQWEHLARGTWSSAAKIMQSCTRLDTPAKPEPSGGNTTLAAPEAAKVCPVGHMYCGGPGSDWPCHRCAEKRNVAPPLPPHPAPECGKILRNTLGQSFMCHKPPHDGDCNNSPQPALYRCPNSRPWCKEKELCGVCLDGEHPPLADDSRFIREFAAQQHGILANPPLPARRPSRPVLACEAYAGCGVWNGRGR